MARATFEQLVQLGVIHSLNAASYRLTNDTDFEAWQEEWGRTLEENGWTREEFAEEDRKHLDRYYSEHFMCQVCGECDDTISYYENYGGSFHHDCLKTIKSYDATAESR